MQETTKELQALLLSPERVSGATEAYGCSPNETRRRAEDFTPLRIASRNPSGNELGIRCPIRRGAPRRRRRAAAHRIRRPPGATPRLIEEQS
jgi:hypothetical protein